MFPSPTAPDRPNDPQDPQNRKDSCEDTKPQRFIGSRLDQFRGIPKVGDQPDRKPCQERPQTTANDLACQGNPGETFADRVPVCDPSRALEHVTETRKLNHWDGGCNAQDHYQAESVPSKTNTTPSPSSKQSDDRKK